MRFFCCQVYVHLNRQTLSSVFEQFSFFFKVFLVKMQKSTLKKWLSRVNLKKKYV